MQVAFEDASVYLFKGKGCMNCKAQEKILEDNNLKYAVITQDTEEGQALFVKYEIHSIPTIVIHGFDHLTQENLPDFKKITGLRPWSLIKRQLDETKGSDYFGKDGD